MQQLNHLVWLFAVVLLSSCTTTIYLVRHAERADITDNSLLSDAGHARAAILRDTLLDKQIKQIFTSTYTRTQQTAAPLASALGIDPILGRYNNDTIPGFVKRLKGIRNQSVLVVAHSHTLPGIIDLLCGETVSVTGNDFDNMFIVKFRHSLGKTRKSLVQTTYGPPSP
ncbi:MAG: phosphoglycerate mutase family protein [Saprospiraceae bacterium]